jgi:endonuclease G, mitochondrial
MRRISLALLSILLVGSGCAHVPESQSVAGPATEAQARPRKNVSGHTLPRGDSLDGSVHVLLGIPTDADPSDDYLLNRKYWVASYNPNRLVANWVSWQLVAADLGKVDRSDAFAADPGLPSSMRAVGDKDYSGTPYDRGHMCNSKDRTSTFEANKSTFLMTNMQPQLHVLNAGPWEGLERYERSLAQSGKQLEIIAGGIFANSTQTIGPGIAVPTANFKIVVVMDPGEKAENITDNTSVYAVVMPNAQEAKGHKWTEYLVSVDKIEQETGYDFLSDIPEAVQKVIEARVATAP